MLGKIFLCISIYYLVGIVLHRSVTPGTVIILLLLLDDSNELEIQEEYDAISADSEFQDLLIESGTTLTLTVSVYGRLCGAGYFKIFLMLTFCLKGSFCFVLFFLFRNALL